MAWFVDHWTAEIDVISTGHYSVFKLVHDFILKLVHIYVWCAFNVYLLRDHKDFDGSCPHACYDRKLLGSIVELLRSS